MKWLLVVLFSSSSVFAVPTEGQKIIMAGPSHYAMAFGEKIARKGGSVADVAVAIGLTLSVVTPYYASLGGGGLALVKIGDQVEALDFRETAPAKTDKKYFLEKSKGASITGGPSVGVPGFAAGLWALHRKYGKLKWHDLFEEPVKLAEKGFQVSGEWAETTEERMNRFQDAGKKFFTKNGQPLKPGDILKQPALAKALRALQKNGETGFYQGPVAQDLVSSVAKADGVLSLEDLKNYKVRWMAPMTHEFKGHKIYLMPPPSSGGVIIKTALSLIQDLHLEKTPMLSTDEFHGFAEILKRAFRGRMLLGDPDFHKNPLNFLLSESYMKTLEQTFKMSTASVFKPLAAGDIPREKQETTHYSILDSQGNSIALTVTLNGRYGSGVVSDTFGIAMNNEMDDFTTRVGEANMFDLMQGEANQVEPGKRPLSSMSPTLVEKDGKIMMSLGAPGGPRIISGVLQVLYRNLVNNINVDDSIQLPRLHHQFQPNQIVLEMKKIAPEVVEGLRKRGHTVVEGQVAKVYVVKRNDKGILEGAFDHRGEGAATGY